MFLGRSVSSEPCVLSGLLVELGDSILRDVDEYECSVNIVLIWV